uniref:Transposase n=1 Tax=Steinernema glaseri TaxID=37863 RepID=A0A1I8A376_9BILA
MHLSYYGQASLDLLEAQIRNSPFLNSVTAIGDDWPKSVFPLVTAFSLKGKPGNRVEMKLTGVKMDSGDIRKLFDHWKWNGKLNFTLSCWCGIVDPRGLARKGPDNVCCVRA